MQHMHDGFFREQRHHHTQHVQGGQVNVYSSVENVDSAGSGLAEPCTLLEIMETLASYGV